MDTETQVSGQATGDEAEPTPQFQPTGGSVPSDVEAIVEKKLAQFSAELDKKLQSQKDKRFSEIEKQIGSLKSLTELREMGVNIPKDVEQEMRLRALEQSVTSPKGGDGTPAQEEAIASAKEILAEANISISDPEVVKLWTEKKYSNDLNGFKSMLSDVTRLAVKRNQIPAQTQAQATTPVQGKAPEPDQVSEYTKEMLGARGNRSALLAIKEKYRKMGVPVDNIGFNV